MDDNFGFYNSPDHTVINMDSPVVRTAHLRNGATSSIPLSSKINLEPFYGYSGDNGKKFLSEFDSFCTLQNLTDDNRIMAAFHLHLKGPALVWYTALDDVNKISWTILREAFSNQYAVMSIFDPAIITESAIFNSLTLEPSQSIEVFHSRILEKRTRLQKPERDMLSKFIEGLPEKLAFFVRAANPRSLQCALQQAKLGEAYGYRNSTPFPSVATVKPAFIDH